MAKGGARTKQTARESTGGKAPDNVPTMTEEQSLQRKNDDLNRKNKELSDDNAELKRDMETLEGKNEFLEYQVERLREHLKITQKLVAAQSEALHLYHRECTANEELGKMRDLMSVQQQSLDDLNAILDEHMNVIQEKEDEIEFYVEALVDAMQD
jgi:chromosome segregation ATPase